MLRVLHLLNHDCGSGASRVPDVLARAADGDLQFASRTIGRGGDSRSFVEAGLALRGRIGGEIDLVHAWDWPGLLAGALSGKPVLFSPSAMPSPAAVVRLAAIMAFARIQIVCSTTTEQALYGRRGIAQERCHVIAPAVEAPVAPARNQGLREALGLGSQDRVFLAPGESSHAAGHRLALHAVSILHVLDPRCRILLWGRGAEVKTLLALGAKLRQPTVVVAAEQTLGRPIAFDELPGVADIALVTPMQTGTMRPVAQCMAAGLPIIAIDTPQAREVIGSDGALFVPPIGPRVIAQGILDLMEHPQKAQDLGRAAQAAALQRFRPEPFARGYKRLYQQLAAP